LVVVVIELPIVVVSILCPMLPTTLVLEGAVPVAATMVSLNVGAAVSVYVGVDWPHPMARPPGRRCVYASS